MIVNKIEIKSSIISVRPDSKWYQSAALWLEPTALDKYWNIPKYQSIPYRALSEGTLRTILTMVSTVFCFSLYLCITFSLSYTGPPSRDQGSCLLRPGNTSSFCTWRWSASVPLLHHPLTVEGQGGPPLSAGPAALIWAERVGWGGCRGEEGLDPLTAPDHWSIDGPIATDPWSVEPTPPVFSCSPASTAAVLGVCVLVWQWCLILSFSL